MSFAPIFEKFADIRVLIIGDVMIDSYLWGSVNRISPEAPVPIVELKKSEKRLGGAANVAMNIQALGATPVLCAVIGEDAEKNDFFSLMDTHNLHKEGILALHTRPTTIKHRIISGHQHILRLDAETTAPLLAEEKTLLWEKIQKLMPTCQVVIFEDYDKGVLDQEIIQKSISFAKKHNIPTVIDPKKRNFLHYQHATFFKPNLKELKEGLKIDFKVDNFDELRNAVQLLKDTLQLDYALVTLSERGILLLGNNEVYTETAYLRAIADVSGAGDTVISVVAVALAVGLSAEIASRLANLAGGLVCEHVGVVSINKNELLAEANIHIKAPQSPKEEQIRKEI